MPDSGYIVIEEGEWLRIQDLISIVMEFLKVG